MNHHANMICDNYHLHLDQIQRSFHNTKWCYIMAWVLCLHLVFCRLWTLLRQLGEEGSCMACILAELCHQSCTAHVKQAKYQWHFHICWSFFRRWRVPESCFWATRAVSGRPWGCSGDPWGCQRAVLCANKRNMLKCAAARSPYWEPKWFKNHSKNKPALEMHFCWF